MANSKSAGGVFLLFLINPCSNIIFLVLITKIIRAILLSKLVLISHNPKTKIDIEHSVSSGNLWADLGFPDAQERQAKSDLAIQISLLIKKKNLTKVKTATLLSLNQTDVEKLSVGKLSGFSLEQLFQFLLTLDQDVTIKVSPKKHAQRKARMTVSLPTLRNKPLVKQNNKLPESKSIHAKKAKK